MKESIPKLTPAARCKIYSEMLNYLDKGHQFFICHWLNSNTRYHITDFPELMKLRPKRWAGQSTKDGIHPWFQSSQMDKRRDLLCKAILLAELNK